MASLQVLGLAGCPVRELSVVTILPALHFVNLHHTGITNLGDLPEQPPGVSFEGVGEPVTAPFDASTPATARGLLADEPAAALISYAVRAHERAGRTGAARLSFIGSIHDGNCRGQHFDNRAEVPGPVRGEQRRERLRRHRRDTEFGGLVGFRASAFADHDQVGLLGHRPR